MIGSDLLVSGKLVPGVSDSTKLEYIRYSISLYCEKLGMIVHHVAPELVVQKVSRHMRGEQIEQNPTIGTLKRMIIIMDNSNV